MITITSAVEQIVARSDFAIEGLETGCLNLSAYADSIKFEVEKLTKKSVQKGSIVVALARLGEQYRRGLITKTDFTLFTIVSRSGLTEIAYPKTPELQKALAQLFIQPHILEAPFCITIVGLSEVAIVVHNDLASSVQSSLPYPTRFHITKLASLTMQVEEESINMPRQSYTIIRQLALRNITLVEYVTSPTELTIILYERDLQKSYKILYEAFFEK